MRNYNTMLTNEYVPSKSFKHYDSISAEKVFFMRLYKNKRKRDVGEEIWG